MKPLLLKFEMFIFVMIVSTFIFCVYQKEKVDKEILKLEQENLRLKKENLILAKDWIEKVTVTAYHPDSKGINSDSDEKNTSLMTKPIPGWTCAVSDDLFEKGWKGSKIYVRGYGVWKVTDKMHKSVKGNQIDLCFGSKKEALNFGKKENISATIIETPKGERFPFSLSFF